MKHQKIPAVIQSVLLVLVLAVLSMVSAKMHDDFIFTPMIGTVEPPASVPVTPSIIHSTNNTSNSSNNSTTNSSNLNGKVDNVRPYMTCFHESRTACPPSHLSCRCQKLKENPQAVVCCDVERFQLLEGLSCGGVGGQSNVTDLHIRNATLDVLNVSMSNYVRLLSMSVTDGRIGRVDGQFSRNAAIKCLNFSNNAMGNMETRALSYLRLKTLDLSHNNLTMVPNLNLGIETTLDVSDNEHLQCESLFRAKNNSVLHFRNGNDTFCAFPRTFTWFNSTLKIALEQVENVYKFQNGCSENCSCEPARLEYRSTNVSVYSFKVNCSGKQLTEMPSRLPENTISLDISNNNITILNLDGENYQNIRELNAANNQIKSILFLEGTKFIDIFVMLDLRNNSIRNLPAYMLSNMFDRNDVARRVYLGLNRLNCDCNTAKNLKVWLLTKQTNIVDYEEIKCENLKENVIDLNKATMCQQSSDQDWTDYIYYIIAMELLLLVCLVLKVSYDYWVFKTAGYLPWPASKMPKLPCDWLCE